jgi:hypothetical protein
VTEPSARQNARVRVVAPQLLDKEHLAVRHAGVAGFLTRRISNLGHSDIQPAGHSDIQPAVLHVEDGTHPSTVNLPLTWARTDEWYDFRTNPRDTPDIHVLITLDESSYSGGQMGDDHPWSWYHAYDGGRAWYTAGGHTIKSYTEDAFLHHLLGGIQYAAGLD